MGARRRPAERDRERDATRAERMLPRTAWANRLVEFAMRGLVLPTDADGVPVLHAARYRRGGAPHPTLPSTVVCDAADVGAYAAYYRWLLDESGAEVAGRAGCGRRFVVEFENGRASVGLDKVLAVLDALGLQLVVRPGPAPNQPAATRGGASALEPDIPW